MQDGRCKLGLAGRISLVRFVSDGGSLRGSARKHGVSPATAHRWWHRWITATEAERISFACLWTQSSRPKSCPWQLSAEDEQRILQARARTGYGPARLAGLVGFCRGTIWKVLWRHGGLSDEVCVVVVSDLGLCAGPPETGAPKGRAALAVRRAA